MLDDGKIAASPVLPPFANAQGRSLESLLATAAVPRAAAPDRSARTTTG